MTKNKNRKPRHRRSRQPPRRPPAGPAPPTPESPPPTDRTQIAWVTVEHRDSDGNPTFLADVVQSTHRRRFSEVDGSTPLRALLLTGYKPHERKIYEVRNVAVFGWQRRGHLELELDGWRDHEQEWFAAMQGLDLEITDHGQPKPPRRGDKYTITHTCFDRKQLTLHHEDGRLEQRPVFHAELQIRETLRSAWRRQSGELLNFAFKSLVAPFSPAVGAGLTILWFQGFDHRQAPSPDTALPADVNARAGRPPDRHANRSATQPPSTGHALPTRTPPPGTTALTAEGPASAPSEAVARPIPPGAIAEPGTNLPDNTDPDGNTVRSSHHASDP